LLLVLNRTRVLCVDVYSAVGLVIWVFVLKVGVHPTLAGAAILAAARRVSRAPPAARAS
jgi:Na+:H+ antiporter, NhaA family